MTALEPPPFHPEADVSMQGEPGHTSAWKITCDFF